MKTASCVLLVALSPFLAIGQSVGGNGVPGANSTNATALRSIPISATVPTLNYCLVYNGTAWAPASCSASAPVTSVFGRTGAVVPASGDYSVGQVTGAAPLASPALTGTPTAPTQTAGDNSTKIATTAYVDQTPKAFKVLWFGAIAGTATSDLLPGFPNAITLISATFYVTTVAVGCTTYPVVNLWDYTAGSTLGSLTLAASTAYYTLTLTTTSIPAGHQLAFRTSTAAAGCSTTPAYATINVLYH